ncbi:ATP-binding protein [Micromonospora sp. WMMA1923]|uniref:sensor histidine kinase n=1 Tax=Micromonospora sp. WMMA1923 TaxID=3404125 RepID=UPI003B95BB0F
MGEHGWRRRLTRRLDPAAYVPGPVSAPEADPWPSICAAVSGRLLDTAQQLLPALEQAQARADDPEQLALLYAVDHGLARLRRQAENLMVLAGQPVPDAEPQVTSLADTVRAATSAVADYRRVEIGPLLDLAVTEQGADDVIRILTELLDNAVRHSPEPYPVLVSAHRTDADQVMVRITDSGPGGRALAVDEVNAMLAGRTPPTRPDRAGAAAPARPDRAAVRLGLLVVRELALAHGIDVHLTAGSAGTTATVLIPTALLCDLPAPADPATPRHLTSTRTTPPDRSVPPDRPVPSDRSVPPGRSASESGLPVRPTAPGPLAVATGPLAVTAAGLPRRPPARVRDDPGPTGPPVETDPTDRQRWPQEMADFTNAIAAHAALKVEEDR